MTSTFDPVVPADNTRSMASRAVFPRFADWELSSYAYSLVVDDDHDGVLEFADFCRVMLLIGARVNATYKEADLLRMFEKVDLNQDRLIDPNEFLWMQITPDRVLPRLTAGASIHIIA